LCAVNDAATPSMRMENAKMTSVFKPRAAQMRPRCEKTYSSSCIGRAGAMAPSAVITQEGSTKEVVFRRAVENALAAGDLHALHQAHVVWVKRTFTADVPLSNDELNKIRRRAVDIARRGLKKATSLDDTERIEEALRRADLVAEDFPLVPQVRSSLEYVAAGRHLEELASSTTASDGVDCEDNAEDGVIDEEASEDGVIDEEDVEDGVIAEDDKLTF